MTLGPVEWSATARSAAEPDTPARAEGEHGSGLVAALVVMFAFTFSALVWLAVDVDRGVSNRSTAGSVAFQAARAGAQQTVVGVLRESADIEIEPGPARAAATQTATELFTSYGVAGTIRVELDPADPSRITTVVTITDGGRTVTGTATVRSERAP